MKFDFVIGNPPYQEETKSDSTRMPPIYHLFMEESYKIGKTVELITPARFLFDAGWTPSEWNQKMLNDEHFKILHYEQVSSNVFSNTDIKGGIAIHYHNENEKFNPIGTFTVFPELNSILQKVLTKGITGVDTIVHPALSFGLTSKVNEDYPDLVDRLRTNAFSSLSAIFHDQAQEDGHDYIRLLGLDNLKRCYKWVRRDYIADNENILDTWKVLLPASNGSGALGEVLSTPLIGEPLIGYTQSFISIGPFGNKDEAENAMKYIKSKFARTMLGILKITQHNPRPKWKYVPLQDFTTTSDIDWSKSIAEIDRQLYAKYGLDENEINFIETKVKEMQ